MAAIILWSKFQFILLDILEMTINWYNIGDTSRWLEEFLTKEKATSCGTALVKPKKWMAMVSSWWLIGRVPLVDFRSAFNLINHDPYWKSKSYIWAENETLDWSISYMTECTEIIKLRNTTRASFCGLQSFSNFYTIFSMLNWTASGTNNSVVFWIRPPFFKTALHTRFRG